ncbi:unnamed protein product, partial [Meganyctiphanes norvegica]
MAQFDKAFSNKKSTRSHQAIEFKYHAIIEVEQGARNLDVANKYGVKPNTLSTWYKNRANIKATFESGTVGTNKKVVKAPQYPNTEEALVRWIHEARAANIYVSGTIIKIQAVELAKEVGELGFTASKGWFNRFQKRHKVLFKKIVGEANSANPVSVEEFRSMVTASLPLRYKPEDIFKCDEFGLVWEAQSNKSFTFKGIKKKPNQRITVLPCANMTGTEKKQLLVIGRYESPKSFIGRKDRLPCLYKWNKKAWMTSEFFTEWLRKWNHKLSIKGRKIALVLDNATCHPEIEFSNIELVFFPPNTMSHTQPMEQGIIANLKVHYRHLYALGHLIPALKAGRDPSFNLFDAMGVAVQAWGLVTPRTIAKSFRHAGFMHPAITALTPEELEDDDLPLVQLAARLTDAGMPCDIGATKEALTEVEDFQTCDISSPEKIAREVLSFQEDDASDSEESEGILEPIPARPTHHEFLEALESLKVVRLYASFGEGKDMEELYALSLQMQAIGIKHEPKKKQTSIKQFFPLTD